MTKIITTTDVLDALGQAVEERGAEYVYQDNLPSNLTAGGCLYAAGGEPACIAGVALHKLGVPIEALRTLDQGDGDSGGWSIGSAAARVILRDHGFDFEDSESQSVMRAAQQEQDFAETWGDALGSAEMAAAKIEGREV